MSILRINFRIALSSRSLGAVGPLASGVEAMSMPFSVKDEFL
jgi:hypothetical protein